MSTRVCTKLCGCVCVCVCERESYPVLSMHNDVNCSCGSCWTPIQHVVFFPSFFMFRRSAMESMIMVTFTPFVLSVHLFHTPPFFAPPHPSSECPLLLHPPLPRSFVLPLLTAHCVRFPHFCFFLPPCPFSLATGQRRNCNVYETL